LVRAEDSRSTSRQPSRCGAGTPSTSHRPPPSASSNVTLEPDEDSQQARGAESPEVPASLVRLGRTARYRQAVTAIATALNLDTDEFSAQLVTALAALAHTTGKDLSEPD
jgi:hypothetical protein